MLAQRGDEGLDVLARRGAVDPVAGLERGGQRLEVGALEQQRPQHRRGAVPAEIATAGQVVDDELAVDLAGLDRGPVQLRLRDAHEGRKYPLDESPGAGPGRTGAPRDRRLEHRHARGELLAEIEVTGGEPPGRAAERAAGERSSSAAASRPRRRRTRDLAGLAGRPRNDERGEWHALQLAVGSATAEIRPSAVRVAPTSGRPRARRPGGAGAAATRPGSRSPRSSSISQRSTSSVTARAREPQRSAASVVLPFPDGPMKAIARPSTSTALACKAEWPSAASACAIPLPTSSRYQ